MSLFIKSTYILIGIIVVMCQDDFGTENGGAEYQNIFKNIPKLFEYMLETLEDKPEVLEKNDAIFRVDEDHEVSDDVVRFQRSANENDVENIEERKDEKKNKNDPSNINKKQPYDEKTHEARLYDRNTHNNIDTEGHNVRNDKRETVRKDSIDTMKMESISKDEYKREAVKKTSTNDSNVKTSVEEEVRGKDVSVFEGNDGKDTTWSLTSEEIAQQALRVEEILEHHNSSKK